MAEEINRRDALKLLAVGGASAAAGYLTNNNGGKELMPSGGLGAEEVIAMAGTLPEDTRWMLAQDTNDYKNMDIDGPTVVLVATGKHQGIRTHDVF